MAVPSGSTQQAAASRAWERQALASMVLAIAVTLSAWIWHDWQRALADAGTEFVNVAQSNALRASLAARDARRQLESFDIAALNGTPLTPDVLQRGLREHFDGSETADWLPADTRQPRVSSSAQMLDPAVWQEQQHRVVVAGQPIFGWAYKRGPEWMLPVFYRRADGSVLVLSLPMNPLLEGWVAPNVQGESPLGLRGFDERILARSPFKPEMLGADGSRGGSAQAVREARQRGLTSGYVVTPATETDSVVRLIAWAEVPGTEMRVLVASARDNVFSRWLGQRWASYALACALLAGSLAVVMWSRARLTASARGEQEARRAAEQTMELVHQALDISRDATWQLDLASGELRFGSDLSLLLGVGIAPAAGHGDDTARTLRWLLNHVNDAAHIRLQRAIAGMREHGEPVYEEFSVLTRQGEQRHLVLRGKVVEVRGAKLALGTLRDVSRLVKSQAEAAQALQMLERVCKLAKIGPWTVDLRSGILEMGPGAREVYQLQPGQNPGPWLDFKGADPASMDGLVAARRALLLQGVGYDLLLPIRALDGSERWVRSTAAAVCGASGAVERVDGALQDVTEAVLAHRRLDASDRRLRELAFAVSSSAQLLLVTDPQERITWCNAAFERVSGYTLDEVRGLRPGPLLQRGPVAQTLRQALRAAIEARTPVRGIRLLNYAKSGRPYWVDLEVAPVLSDNGELQSYVGLQTDVTADIERETAMAQTQARYDLATRNANIGIWEQDLHGRSTRWNSVMFELTGCAPEAGEPKAPALRQRIHPNDLDTVVAGFKQAARDPLVFRYAFEFQFERAPGQYRWLRNQCVFERNGRGRPVRVVGTLLDITIERELSAERSARLEAQGRNAAKTAFLSSMSHELRTPLNAIIGYAQLVNNAEGSDLATLHARVRRIETAGRHLLGLIDEILDLACIEAGNSRIEVACVALHEVVADAIDLVTPQAQEQRIVVHATLQPAWVAGDAQRLRQVAVNLLSNAVKYNVEGGSVFVAVGSSAGGAVLEVRDTGLGMDKAQLARLFQPFNRLGREALGVQGTGIGLTITKMLLELMGGTLAVESQPAQGSTFRVRLAPTPAAKSATLHQPHAAPNGRAATRALQVLCIEDNEVNALLLEEAVHLLQPGWTVRQARSLAAASQALQEKAWDLVLLDENLPDGQGLHWAASKAVRRHLAAHAEVVMLTADAMPELRERALAQGIRMFMHKPFELDELRAALDAVARSVDTV